MSTDIERLQKAADEFKAMMIKELPSLIWLIGVLVLGIVVGGAATYYDADVRWEKRIIEESLHPPSQCRSVAGLEGDAL